MSQAKNKKDSENIPLTIFREHYAPRIQQLASEVIKMLERRFNSSLHSRGAYSLLSMCDETLQQLDPSHLAQRFLDLSVRQVVFRGSYNTIGQAFRDLREQTPLSIASLSRITGVDPSTLCKIEHNTLPTRPTPRTYQKILTAYTLSETDRQTLDHFLFPERKQTPA
ncbi:MAG: helix-turn-helix transcriptional regulator [Candidatus Woesearchaeota archaeon]|nr:helix-turn-helix transcriptional regulator [Candidatus Woesearchaeota archaeon]